MDSKVIFLGGTSVDLIQNRENNMFGACTGGSVTNTCLIASKLGLNTALLSRIGKDTLGKLAIEYLKFHKVDTSGMIQDKKIKTPIAIAKIDNQGNSSYDFYKNTPKDSMVPFKSTSKGFLGKGTLFHIGSSFSYRKETSEETLKYLRFFKNKKTFISFDPNIRPYAIKDKKGTRERLFKILEYVDLARLSEIDLIYITGKNNIKKGLKCLRNKIKGEIVLTLGNKGSIYLNSDDKFIRFPAFKVRVADTIGAGDGFTSGLIYNIIKKGKTQTFKDIRTSLAFSSAVSALICEKHGAGTGIKGLTQIKKFLKRKRLVYDESN